VDDGEKAIDYLSGVVPYADRSKFPVPILMLLDLKLPRKSGFEILEWVRGHAAYKKLPVVVRTSSEQSEDINRAYSMGANSYLVKPGNFEGLLRMTQTIDT
jgi:DNA-binding response OmpR family regulator